MRTYLNKLTLLENKLGAESLASVHPDVHDSLRDHFEWEVEQVVGEIVWLKKAIHDLAPSDAMIIPTTTHVPTTKLSKRDASNLGQDKENTKVSIVNRSKNPPLAVDVDTKNGVPLFDE